MSKTYSAGIVTAYGAAKRAGYQGTYEDFCRQQAGYAESAAAVEQAKNTAIGAANTATTKAGEATTAATAAQTAKTQTEAAASQALTDIGTERSGAISAVQTEGQTQTANARAQAQAAATSANTASTKASEASASATSAGQSATNAAASATSAANAASAAQGVLESIPQDYTDLSEDVEQLKADLDSLDESLSDVQADLNAIDIPTADHTRYFEIGNILYSSSGWSYGNSSKRIRTKRGISFHLPAGRKLGLTDYTNARYYVSWKKEDGTYDNRGWLREDFTAPVEGDYVFIATAVPEADVVNINDLASLVYGLLDIPESIEKVYESVAKIENGVTMQTEHLGTILSAYPQKYPEFSSANNTLTIFAETMLILRGGANYVKIATVDTVIDLSTVASQAKKVYYNLTSGTFSVVAYSNPCADDDVLICTIRRTPEKAYVSMSCPFYVNGEPFGFDFKGIVSDGIVRSGINSHVKAICHRGLNSVAPENTIPAYKEAVLGGFKYVETDVMFTSDGVPVLLHDDTINRTARNADGTEISTDIDIETITYADLLQYDFGIWKDTKYTGTKIPKLEDFLIFCRNAGLHPYVEIKSTKTYTEAQIQSLVDLAKRCGMKGRMTWISMSLTYLQYVASYDATARLGYVVSTSPTVSNAVGLRTGQNDVFIDAGTTIGTSKIEECMNADMPLEVWTTDSANAIKNLHPYIQGVTSNAQRADKILLEYALDS